MHHVFFYNLLFASGVWLSLPDWQHLQGGTGVYYGEDSAEEIWIWPQYYWPSVNYGTFLTDCSSRQNGKHMLLTFIFKILILFFHMNNQMIYKFFLLAPIKDYGRAYCFANVGQSVRTLIVDPPMRLEESQLPNITP